MGPNSVDLQPRKKLQVLENVFFKTKILPASRYDLQNGDFKTPKNCSSQ